MGVTHAKVSGVPNDPAEPEKVGGGDWDAAHVIALDAADIPTHTHAGEDIASGTVADARVAATLARDAEVTTAVGTHEAAGDPHPGYLTTAEGNAAYEASGAVSTHAGLADPHTGYRLESADHTHATTGLQGGTIAHSALTGLTTGDPHTQYVQEADANWVDLTDGGETALHSHAGGAGGAPTNATYLVTTADATLSNEVVVGATPGGELGGTWASPTVDATHAGGTHLTLGTAPSTQAFADAAAGGAATDAAKTDHKHAMPTLGFGLTGNSAPAVGLTTASAFATAETTLSAATYADIAGCSVSLAAGTWLVFGHVVGRAVNAIIQGFVAITHSDNTVISESAFSRPASGTANLNSPTSASWFAIVSPGSTTTYKLRGARGLTTHTGSWIAMDGTGFNTTNHASNNSDKGTGIFAVRIA
jgi:hypothetical protein